MITAHLGCGEEKKEVNMGMLLPASKEKVRAFLIVERVR